MTDVGERLRLHRLWTAADPAGVRFVEHSANLSYANLRGANLRGADMPGANLSYANLRGANLSYANLRDANLRDANLSYADLRDADLRDSNLRDSNLRDANLRGANLRGANLDFSAWPLWCGSVAVTVDERIARQLVYHALVVALPHMPAGAVTPELLEWANKFHRVGEVPPLSAEAAR